MFIDRSDLLINNPMQQNYGIAISDIDKDGQFEIVVAGYGFPNRVYRWNGSAYIDITPEALADPRGQAIGVVAADLDGDGHEELYVLNSDTFSGPKRSSDRLFDFDGGGWVDLFGPGLHGDMVNRTAGRSVAAVDRSGRGVYGFFVACYDGPMRLYELDEDGRLLDVAPQAGLAQVAGGRALVALPLVSDHLMDIFAANENGGNFLFRNRGDGTFEEIASQKGISDPMEHGRGVAVLDANGDGRFDLICGNWEGPHRLYMLGPSGMYYNSATPEMAAPSRVRTVIAADFDNDGHEEIFFNNIGQPNRLFGWRGSWRPLDPGTALEPRGLGTGAAVGDFDGDGRLELVISHGESGFQPLTLYKTAENNNLWLRVMPLTPYGAPARGAVVELVAGGRRQLRAIDAGSGYLCQMEPVAHFGLGEVNSVDYVTVRWPDGQQVTVHTPPPCQVLRVPHPRRIFGVG